MYDQKENTAAFFRDPKVYTIDWLMKRPTVMPMVTAIMAPPMSIPFPFAVIPPAEDKPDYDRGCQRFSREYTLQTKAAYRNEEKNTCDHGCKRRPSHLARVYVAQ